MVSHIYANLPRNVMVRLPIFRAKMTRASILQYGAFKFLNPQVFFFHKQFLQLSFGEVKIY